MKFKQNLVILSAIWIAVLILGAGCLGPVTETSITIAADDAATNDSTPTLTISAVGAVYMAFSGDETAWSAWVVYNTIYNLFNITTGEGCTTGDGEKTVYVKFKKANGTEFGECHDTIKYDATKPKLKTAVYSDAKSKASGTVDKGDTITFTFDEEMDTSTITSSNFSTRLPLSGTDTKYGTDATFSWSSDDKECKVTLGTSPSIPYGTTVDPSYLVKDVAGNADDSSDVTISGLDDADALVSVTIDPSTYTCIEGDTTTKTFTATAKNGAGNEIASPPCTFTWLISPTTGLGSLNNSTTSSVVYASPASGTGTATIEVTAKYEVVTKTKTATVTVEALPAHIVDPDNLFVSVARGQMAKYTSVPTGGRVEVYSGTFIDGSDKTKKATLINNGWTNAPGIAEAHYIFFEVIDSNGVSSGIITDGQVPAAPNPGALLKIEVTNATTANASPDGNVFTNDQITLYILTSACSNATTITGDDTTINLIVPLIAGDQPLYSKTDPTSGHESGLTVAGADGTIVKIAGADYAGGAVDGIVETNDTITITYSGNVTVTPAPVSFDLGGKTIKADLAQGESDKAVLTITDGPYDLSTQTTVNFNLADKNIVDNVGGDSGDNWAFEHADGIDWEPGTDF